MKEIQLYCFLIDMQLRNDKPVTVGEIRAHLRIPDATLYRMLRVLIDEGLVFKLKRGQYCIGSSWLTSALNDVNRQYDSVKWIKML